MDQKSYIVLESEQVDDNNSVTVALPKYIHDSNSSTTLATTVETKSINIKSLRTKIDIRLCSIAAIINSLVFLDGAVVAAASVTTMLEDLNITPDLYSISIFMYSVSSILFQLPLTIAVRLVGPRIYFSVTTLIFGIITLCDAFVTNATQFIVLKILLGIMVSGTYPGISLMISNWYPRSEQQIRFAFLETGEVLILGIAGIANYGLNHLNGTWNLKGWQWMFIVQGLFICVISVFSYWWMVDFPEESQSSYRFLTKEESEEACLRNLIYTALSYFTPIILNQGLNFDENKSILLAQVPFFYGIIPALISSYISDKYRARGLAITINCIILIIGISLLGFVNSPAVRYLGIFLATGSYISNFPAINTYVSNNVAGQWKRVASVAMVNALDGFGSVAGSFLLREEEAPWYPTAIWVGILSQAMMIACVGVFSIYFKIRNKQQMLGRIIIERTPGFRYTF